MNLFKEQNFIAYFFPQNVFGFHQPLDEKCSRADLQKIRVASWLILSTIYFWQFNIVKSIFIEVAYLTSIGFFTSWLYFSVLCFDLLLKYSKISLQVTPKLKYYVHGIFELALTLEVPITLAYWTIILPFDLKYRRTIVLYLMFALHSLPILCLLVDFNFNRTRFHIRRVLFPMSLVILYVVFNIIYTLSVKPLYPILKWKGPKSYIITGVLLVITFLSFIAFRYLKTGRTLGYETSLEIRQEESTVEVSEKGSKMK